MLFLLTALGALATNIILPAFPAMSADLGVSVRDPGATLSSFFLTFALGQLFVGPLSDRFGRQRLVLIGLAVFIIGSLVCAAASTLPQLIGGRVVQALGVCATSVLSRAIARDLFEGQELARALSLTMVAMAAAPGFSPLLGSALESLFGWRSSFFVISALAFALAVAYFTKLGETHAPDQRSALSLVDVAAGYKQLAFDRRLTAPALSVSLVIGALYAFFSMAPAVLITGFGLSPLTFGLFFASTTIVVFGSGVLAPRLARRWGPVVAARAGVAVALVGSAAMLFGRADLASFSVSLTIFLFGMGIFNPLGTAIALQPFAQQAGAASALLGFLQMGCAALAITFGGMLALPTYTVLAAVLFTSLLAAFLRFWSIRVTAET